MSRLDTVSWRSKQVSMKILGSINIPEIAVPPASATLHTTTNEEVPTEPHPFSPTLSMDSGRGTSTALWPSSNYFIHGGPGFSIGILDANSGLVNCLPVPVPTLSFLESPDASNFSLSEVTTLALAGESQVWAGTESGSLHVFDLIPGPRLANHVYTKLPHPVTCLKTDQLAVSKDIGLAKPLPIKTEVLVGSPKGNLTVIRGEADERGGLSSVDKCPRKVIQLGGFEEGNMRVECIALVSSSSGIREDYYWCGCGPSIVVLRRSNWKMLVRLDGSAGLHPDTNTSHLTQLEATEYGVWSSMSQSSTMLLWDNTSFNTILKISCFNSQPETPLENCTSQVKCLVYSESLLLVGTQGGYLLVFSIHKKLKNTLRTRHMSLDTSSLSLHNSPKLNGRSQTLDYRLMAATHCCSQPVVSIHLIGIPGNMGILPESPLPSSPNHSLNILVVFGSGTGSLDSIVQLYEMANSPLPSPMTSPQITTTDGGRLSTTSTQSLPVRCKLQDLDIMPKLTLHRVTKGSISYLPLHNNTSLW